MQFNTLLIHLRTDILSVNHNYYVILFTTNWLKFLVFVIYLLTAINIINFSVLEC